MNLKILFLILVYYGVLSLFLIFGGAVTVGIEGNVSFQNDSRLQGSEIDTGGLFGSGVSFSRFFGLITLGIGLPDDTPSWFAVMFFLWQTIVTILSVGFVISSIWDG